jgi:integrase/recombinase XerD
VSRALDPRWPKISLVNWPQHDKTAWAAANGDPHPLHPERGFARRWKPATLMIIEVEYGRWIGWLTVNGLLDPASDPAERATRKVVGDYLDAMQEAGLADFTRSIRLKSIGDALKAMRPGADTAWIGRGASRIHSDAESTRPLLERMRPPAEILQLAADLMHEAEHGRFRLPVDRAHLYRDGLMIGLQVYRAIRRKNLAEIELGKHLMKRDRGWRLEFDDMKGKTDYEAAWPCELVAPLERYLAHYRPILLAGDARRRRADQHLWVGAGGVAMCDDALAYRFRIRTEEAFGISINMHTFRHIAATFVATEKPDAVAVIAGLLSHAGHSTAEKYYNKANALAAVGLFHQEMSDQRRE